MILTVPNTSDDIIKSLWLRKKFHKSIIIFFANMFADKNDVSSMHAWKMGIR